MVKPQDQPNSGANNRPWIIIAALLLFLGINKWLDLQTLLMHLGRAATRTTHWYKHRRAAQTVFVMFFTLVVLAALASGLRKWRRFCTENRLALVGIVMLFLFILVRAATINHVSKRLHLNLYDDRWGWILEVLATACFVLSATRMKARYADQPER
jgi:hypothetical protein